MALALENALNVRNRVKNALGALGVGTTAGSGDPSLQYAFKSFFLNQAANKGNPDLQFVPITAAGATTGQGEDHGIDAACQVYAIFVKKTATATDSYYNLADDADADSEIAGDGRVVLALLEAGDYAIVFYPNGLPLAAGAVSSFTTTSKGETESAAADAGNGFLILGN